MSIALEMKREERGDVNSIGSYRRFYGVAIFQKLRPEFHDKDATGRDVAVDDARSMLKQFQEHRRKVEAK